MNILKNLDKGIIITCCNIEFSKCYEAYIVSLYTNIISFIFINVVHLLRKLNVIGHFKRRHNQQTTQLK